MFELIIQHKKVVILSSISFGLALLVLLSAVFLPSQNQQPTPPPSRQPTPSYNQVTEPNPKSGIDYDEEYLKKQEEINKSGDPQLKKDKLVSQFMDTLPYQGRFGRVVYTIDDNRVTLYFNPQQKEQALAEFDELLKRNGIESRDWVYNLFIKADLY
jgi:hypothetical protein